MSLSPRKFLTGVLRFHPLTFKTIWLSKPLNGNEISILQPTDYPNEGLIKIEVIVAEPVKFSFRLRIPHWSRHSNVSVDGTTVEAQPGSYASIEREWKTGDIVTLEMDMSLRAMVGENSCARMICLYRGPLLLAAEVPDSNIEFSKEFISIGAQARSTNVAGAWVECSFQGRRVSWVGQAFDDAGQAKVMIDGKEIATVSQYTAGRGVPFQWESPELAEGRHTIRLEVTGTAIADSKGSYVNVTSLRPSDERPSVNLNELTAVVGNHPPIRIAAHSKESISLLPFRDACRESKMYYTWFWCNELPVERFSKSNPSRSWQLRQD